MDKLEALLTGWGYKQIVASPRPGHALAVRDDGKRLVFTLTNELQDALTDADDRQLVSVAVLWSQMDEFWGRFR
jgi:hypothetical protein